MTLARAVGIALLATCGLSFGADYVAYGAFFPTTTKDAATHAEPELMTIRQEIMEVPCVAIACWVAALFLERSC